MPVESTADRLSFLNPDEFGVTATYTPAGGSAVPDIAGIFNDPHLSVNLGGDVPVSDSQPTFICQSEDLPGAAKGGDIGDTLIVALDSGNVTYRVADLQPDGTGLTVITLAGN